MKKTVEQPDGISRLLAFAPPQPPELDSPMARGWNPIVAVVGAPATGATQPRPRESALGAELPVL